MRLLSEQVKLSLPEFKPGELVSHVMREGYAIACELQANEAVKCPMCGSKEGYKVKNGFEVWWACTAKDCIRRNARKPVYKPKQNIDERMLLGGFPRKLVEQREAEWKHSTSLLQQLIAWVKKPTGCLVLHGLCGSGKTFASTYATSRYLDFNGGTARFYGLVDTKYQWLEEMRPGAVKTLPMKMQSCGLLVLDDIDKVDPSSAFYEFLYLIINSRYSSGRPTIVNTNLDPEGLRQLLGDALADRILATGGAVLSMQGRNLRC